MKILNFDALVIGSGCAGFNAADSLWSFGVKNIALATEGVGMGTSRNTGSDKQTYYKLSLAGDEGDSVGLLAQSLYAGGGVDGDVALAEAAGSVRAFCKLANLGVRFPTNELGEYVGYKTDHDPFRRATSVGPYTSKRMTEVLEDAVRAKNIPILDGLQAVKILTDAGGVTGVLFLDRNVTDRAEWVAVRTANVILATGGPASVYADCVYPASQTGASALAFDAGAVFSNLSEWQYGLASVDFRWNVSGTYQQVLPRYVSVDADGVEREFLREWFDSDRELLKNCFLKGYEWPFDARKCKGSSVVDLLVYRESVLRGRRVYLDFTREPTGLERDFSILDPTAYEYLKNSDALIPTPIARLERMNPGAISLYREHGIDLAKEPLRIAVCAQHCNGGVAIDAHWQSSVAGLFVAGEAAGSFGLFRPGGSALNSCQVGSFRAAEEIAYGASRVPSSGFGAIASAAVAGLENLLTKARGTSATYPEIYRGTAAVMSGIFAFLRRVPAMESALADLQAAANSFDRVAKWADFSDLPAFFKAREAVLAQAAAASAILYSAKRFGSRGAALVTRGEEFLPADPLPSSPDDASRVIETVLTSDGFRNSDRPVRPIPSRNLWFESVWKQAREREKE